MFKLEDFLKEAVFLTDQSGKIHLGWGGLTYRTSPLEGQGCFYAPDFFLKNNTPWVIPRHFMTLNLAQFKKDFDKFKEKIPEMETDFNWVDPNKQQFEKQFLEIYQKISTGEMDKAVPLVFETSKGRPNSAQLLKIFSLVLSKLTENQFAYGFWNAKEGMIGVTPEYLFEGNGESFTSMALAGTRTENEKSLLEDNKELKEHQFVVKDITDKLSTQGIELEKLLISEEKFKNLHHLKTRLAFKNIDLEFESLVKVMHPTSALGVYPKEIDFLWLSNQPEASVRERYGAPFGYAYKDKSICLVAIRNIQWNETQTLLASGCGVVKESESEKEWLELAAKRQSVKSNLGLL